MSLVREVGALYQPVASPESPRDFTAIPSSRIWWRSDVPGNLCGL